MGCRAVSVINMQCLESVKRDGGDGGVEDGKETEGTAELGHPHGEVRLGRGAARGSSCV